MVLLLAALAIVAASSGIFTNDGAGSYSYLSVRNKEVTIYGKGLYKHMSAEVAPQGIAQDYVTLFLAVPLLLVSLFLTRKGSEKAKFVLTGTTGYLLVTYFFYLVMSMYNSLFLVYVMLLALAFYSFLLLVQSFDKMKTADLFSEQTPVKWMGGFLIFNSISIALLWLGIVIPPILDGTVIPVQAEHYTTLIVQGLDLAILLPAAFIVGRMFYKKQPEGYIWAPVYFVFLSLLMTALTAKVLAKAWLTYDVVPAIFIIPAFNLISVFFATLILKNIKQRTPASIKKSVHAKPAFTK